MKMVKSLILGSAAGLIAMSGAQAADLPVKAKAVEYVRICSLYGAGFFYIPGTDTCIKLGGYLRVDTTFNGNIYGGPAWSGDLGQGNRFRDYFTSRSRLALTVDTRTATEYGVVRTFGQGDFQFSNFGTSNPAVNGAFPTGAFVPLGGPGTGYVAVEMVFIQFAGFTFGKSASAFAAPWHGYPGNNNSFLMGGHDTVTGVNNIQYTAQFGNGVSATIGLDDPTVFHRTAVQNLSTATSATVGPVSANGTGVNAYGGTWAPDIVGNIRVDQAWGLLQLSAGAHLVNASYNTLGAGGVSTNLSEISGHPDSKWGYSVQGALQIKNIPTGAGDDIKISAVYSRGNTKDVISTSSASPSFVMFGGSGFGYQSVGYGNTTDGVYVPGVGGTGGIILTSAWGVRGAFNHNWDPYWSSSLWGAYSSVRYDGGANDNINGLGSTTAKGAYCAGFAGSHVGQAAVGNNVGNYTCNPDFNIAQIGVVTRWTPVKNLTFSAELGAAFLDQKMSGSFTHVGGASAAPAPKPNALYEFKDQSTVFLNVRAQRNF